MSQLKAWADAKDLAKQYEEDNVNNLASVYTNISSAVQELTSTGTAEDVTLDTLANKWGYKLFEYAHNNVCGRVLDSCFNGIYEACGTPVSVTDSEGKTHKKCANGLTSSCPFNYNSYISVTTEGDKLGDVVLNERVHGSTTADSSASCFGYTSTTTTTGTRTVSTTTSDPYYSLRGPVADARRSIMQKYLLDANSACDVYGEALKKTAQNINYQKIAAQQALQQKRLEFKQQADSAALAEATAAIDNFNECISEIWDCYDNYSDEDEKWTTARIKAYCSQVSQVPHCYETMICSPLQTQLTAVTDLPDSDSCKFSTDYNENTCRNVVTISEILYGTGVTPTGNEANILTALGGNSSVPGMKSAAIREACLQRALTSGATTCDSTNQTCLRGWKKGVIASESTASSDTYTITYYSSVDGSSPAATSNVLSPLSYVASSEIQTIIPTIGNTSNGRLSGLCVFGSSLDISNADNALDCGSSSFNIPAGRTGSLYVVEYWVR